MLLPMTKIQKVATSSRSSAEAPDRFSKLFVQEVTTLVNKHQHVNKARGLLTHPDILACDSVGVLETHLDKQFTKYETDWFCRRLKMEAKAAVATQSLKSISGTNGGASLGI